MDNDILARLEMLDSGGEIPTPSPPSQPAVSSDDEPTPIVNDDVDDIMARLASLDGVVSDEPNDLTFDITSRYVNFMWDTEHPYRIQWMEKYGPPGLDIRHYYVDDVGANSPTKKGIRIPDELTGEFMLGLLMFVMQTDINTLSDVAELCQNQDDAYVSSFGDILDNIVNCIPIQ